MPIPLVVWLVLTPLFTGIPTGYILVRLLKRQDIRETGSGNIGATNVRRLLGTGWSIVVLILDAVKGALPVILARVFDVGGTFMSGWELPAIGILSVLGNVFSPWLGFKGGKGVATSLGVALALSWQATLVILGFFILVVLITDFISLASILSVWFFAVAVLMVAFLSQKPVDLPLVIFGVALAIVVTWTHRENIRRLLKGEERKFIKSKKKQ